mmetsp:Transcript_109825/g.309672  ORF Transcript_109825/g.309672 Transcript_109825/m.309672 type:complete len:243 (-) Transcript_109825:47-775(-)
MRVAALRREHEGRAVRLGFRQLDVGAASDERLARLYITSARGNHQRAHALIVDGVATNATLEKHGHLGCVALLDGLKEGRDDILVEADDPQVAARNICLRRELCWHAKCHAELCGLCLRLGVRRAEVVRDGRQRLEVPGFLFRCRQHWRHLALQNRLHPFLAAIRKEREVTLVQGFAARDSDRVLQHAATRTLVLVEANAKCNVHGIPIPSGDLALQLACRRLHEIGHRSGAHGGCWKANGT